MNNTTWIHPRPEIGTDYGVPDPGPLRCPTCNPDGMNRTGLMPTGPVGAPFTVDFGAPCPAGCRYGLKPIEGGKTS